MSLTELLEGIKLPAPVALKPSEQAETSREVGELVKRGGTDLSGVDRGEAIVKRVDRVGEIGPPGELKPPKHGEIFDVIDRAPGTPKAAVGGRQLIDAVHNQPGPAATLIGRRARQANRIRSNIDASVALLKDTYIRERQRGKAKGTFYFLTRRVDSDRLSACHEPLALLSAVSVTTSSIAATAARRSSTSRPTTRPLSRS